MDTPRVIQVIHVQCLYMELVSKNYSITHYTQISLLKLMIKNNNLKSAIKNKILIRDNYSCFYCSAWLFQVQHTEGFGIGKLSLMIKDSGYGVATVDHLTPLCLGGDNRQSNLVACCMDCNLEKGNRPYQTSFIGWLQFLTTGEIERKHLKL